MGKNRITTLETAYNKAAAGAAAANAGLRLGYALRYYDMNRAESVGLAVVQESESRGLLHQQAWAHRLLGLLATLRGDTSAAALHAEQAKQLFHHAKDQCGMAAVEFLQALQARREGKDRETLQLLKKILKIFTAHNAVDVSIETLIAIGGLFARTGNFDTAEKNFRAAMALQHDEDGLLAGQLLLAMLQKDRGETIPALEQLQKLYEQATAKGMMVVACRAIHTLGKINSEIGNYPAALEQLNNCLSISQSQKLLPLVVDAHRSLSIIYKNLRDYPAALSHATHSLNGTRQLGNRYLESSTLGSIGNIYYPLKEMDTALNFYQQSLALAEEIHANDIISIQLENIANIHRDSGDSGGALAFYQRGLALNINLGDRFGEAHCKFNIGMLYNDIGQPTVGMPYLHEALAIAESAKNPPLLADIHSEIARCWELSELPERFQHAYHHLSTFMKLREMMVGQERQREIGRLQQQLAAEQSLRQQEGLERQQQELQQELRHTQEKLTIAGVHLAKKNEIIATMQKRLEGLLKTEKTSEHLSVLMKEIISEFSTAEAQQDWVDFQKKLETVHQGFLSQLSQKYPDLHPAELRVCALLRTQLSTKEIANLFNVSDRAIEKLRYQARKKIGLDGKQNLSAFLASF
jgi:tetratricopeptide (TPR) repeat protein/DNA-binding CsgD family transcriptional regulator